MTTRNYPENRKTSPLVKLAAARASAIRFHGRDSEQARTAGAALTYAKLKAAIEAALPDMTDEEKLALARPLLPDGWKLWQGMEQAEADRIARVLG